MEKKPEQKMTPEEYAELEKKLIEEGKILGGQANVKETVDESIKKLTEKMIKEGKLQPTSDPKKK